MLSEVVKGVVVSIFLVTLAVSTENRLRGNLFLYYSQFCNRVLLTCIIAIFLILVILKVSITQLAEGFCHFAHFSLYSAELLVKLGMFYINLNAH